MRLHGRKLKVGPFTYTIWSDRSAKDTLAANGMSGAHLGDQQIIMIEPGIAAQQRAETLLHEALHAIWHQTFLALKYPDSGSNSDGENIINELSPRLMQLLRDNPWLVTVLRAE